MAAILLFALVNSKTQGPAAHGWQRPDGAIWAGVKLYTGSGAEKAYVGEVLGGNDRHLDPLTGRTFRGVKIRYPNGTEEWKDRDSILQADSWRVRADDPAIKESRWQVLEY